MMTLPASTDFAPSQAATGRATTALVVCFLVAFADGYDTLMLSFLAPLISKEWAVAPKVLGSIFAAGFAGALIGAFGVGAAADRFGRKVMLLVSIAIAGGFGVACAWAQGTDSLMLLRFLAGIGLGGAIPVVSAMAADYVAAEKRSGAVTRIFLGFPIGAVAGGALTAFAMHAVGWRGVFVVSGIATLLLIPLSAALLSEPRRHADLPGALPVPANPIREALSHGRTAGGLLLCLSVFLILVVSYFLLTWMPILLVQAGVSAKLAALSAVLLNLGGVVGALTFSYVIGKRNPFVPTAACLAVGAALVVVFGMQTAGGVAASFLLVFGIGLMVFGGQIAIPGLAAYFYPREVRATGGGITMAAGRLGAIAGPLIGGLLVSMQLGWDRLLLIAAVPALIAAVAMAAIAFAERRAHA